MRSNRVHLALAALACVLAACGSAGDDTAPTTSAAGTSAGSSASSTPSECPLFDGTACEGFLDGCWAPDTAGSCTDTGLKLTWADGHAIQRTGGAAGLYGPDDSSPCITLEFEMATQTSTLTNVATGETLKNTDLGDGNIQITCTDGSELVFTVAELDADNVCKGIACP